MNMKRVLLGYLFAPLVPATLELIIGGIGALGIALVYWVFGFVAILVLGTPLLFWYHRCGWTGYLPFFLGGGVCAAITFSAVYHSLETLIFMLGFALAGGLSGLLLRAILFGFRAV